MVDRILTAGAVITMDDTMPRADAVAVSGDTIVAVGTLEQCQAALPGAEVVDTGAAVLAPGFIDPHSHPLASGSATQAPAHSIAPWDAQSWDDALKIFHTALAESAPGTPLVFAGFDALLLEHPAPTATELDEIFGDRIVGILDHSGHAVYFTSATIRDHGWDATPPADPSKPVLVAGDPEAESRARRLAEGIPVPDSLVEKLRGVCERAGVACLMP